tara:strand:+ start:214 stop:693 length:480 start_codon:yes stop_codon:yes gene_type:complete
MSRRSTRQSETIHPSRDEEDRAEAAWIPPAVLDAPPVREGFRQRWVATSILGEPVPHHTVRRLREGWTPRPKDTVPDSFPVPTIAHGEYEGFIGVEGMLLCELPEARARARERYFKGKTNDLSKSIDTGLNRAEQAGGIAIAREGESSHSRGPSRVASD